jgi:sugar/nucleoside kinase (ribokinase family)
MGTDEPGIDETSVVDVLFCGTAFLDLVLAGLPCLPTAGTEVWASARAVSPGGIANHATAAARLGLVTALVAAVGTDAPGDLLWDALRQEGLDLAWSRRMPEVATPLTVALVHGGERSFVSHGRLDPVPVGRITPTLPLARAAFASLDGGLPPWLVAQRALGCLAFTDVGWDPSLTWPASLLDELGGVDVFLPNAAEAMAYTRTDSPERAMTALAEHVPLVVVTLGAAGAMALDAATGERATASALPGPTTDPTGAGDVFTAAFMAGTLAGYPLADRLAFATLCSGLSVRRLGGAASAPGLAEVEAAGWPLPFTPQRPTGPAAPTGPAVATVPAVAIPSPEEM